MLILITAVVATIGGHSLWPPITKPLNLALFLIGILGVVVSTLVAMKAADGRAALNGGWHVLSLLLLAMLTPYLATDPRIARALAGLLIGCAVFQATFALHQYFVGMPKPARPI